MSDAVEWFEFVRRMTENILNCECGNADWTQFLYVGVGSSPTMAGCKKCGNVYIYDTPQHSGGAHKWKLRPRSAM